jgi:hypothetical protein
VFHFTAPTCLRPSLSPCAGASQAATPLSLRLTLLHRSVPHRSSVGCHCRQAATPRPPPHPQVPATAKSYPKQDGAIHIFLLQGSHQGQPPPAAELPGCRLCKNLTDAAPLFGPTNGSINHRRELTLPFPISKLPPPLPAILGHRIVRTPPRRPSS